MGGQLQQAAVEGQVEHGAQAYGREVGVDRGPPVKAPLLLQGLTRV
ncbi:hypothetical protein [Nonomuraea sp. NPDC049709]